MFLSGELDLLTAPQLRQIVEAELDSYERVINIILVLDQVDFIDSSGLGVILGRYKSATQRGGKMLAVGPKPQITKILELAGVTRIIPIFPTTEDALTALEGGK